MSRLRYFIALLSLSLLLIPAAAQSEPLSVPLSPEQAAKLPASLRGDPRAQGGGIVIDSVEVYSCLEGQLVLNLAMIVPPSADGYIIRTTVRQASLFYSRARNFTDFDSGVYVWTISHETAGGSAPGVFPMQPETPTTVSMLLLTGKNEPLWYTDATFECDGPANTFTKRDGPVTLTLLNPSFDKAGKTGKTAANWTLTPRVTRNCTAIPGDCVLKMKGKVNKNVSATQKRKFKHGLGTAGDPYGFLFVYDSSPDVSGVLPFNFTLSDIASDAVDTTSTTPAVAAGAVAAEFFFGLTPTSTLDFTFDKIAFTIGHGGFPPTGSVSLRSAYAWVADQLD